MSKNNYNHLKSEKETNSTDDDSIAINLKESGLAEFTQRNLPTDKDVEKFDEFVASETEDEDNDTKFEIDYDEKVDDEIEESLNEIYQDDDGQMVDVKRFSAKKRKGFFFWTFIIIFLLGSVSGVFYYFYENYYLNKGTDAAAVNFTIEGKSEVVAGEEYFYTINYKNASDVNIVNSRIEIKFPQNFIFLDAFPEMTEKNIWKIDNVSAGEVGKIKIKGSMLGPSGESGVVLASITYSPENFSSEFKKSVAISTSINDIGLRFEFDYNPSALVNNNNEILIRFHAKEDNFINTFRVEQVVHDSIEFVEADHSLIDGDELAKYSNIRPGVWQVDEVLTDDNVLPVNFKFTNQDENNQKVTLNFEKLVGESRYIKFFSKEFSFEVMKNDLNLTMIINGKRSDQGVNFGDRLNYSLVYANKGETEMKDVVITAILNSDFLNWTTLTSETIGVEHGNAIVWTKNEISELALVDKDEEGTIDFSINIKDLENVQIENSDYEIESYAQFNVGDIDGVKDDDSKSNTIVNKINSDLKLSEKVLYFNNDNVPVGSGPHPPKVGSETSYKVYWKLVNTLHELKDLKVSVVLPDYMSYSDKAQFSAGSIEYNENTREIVWNIGRLPITVHDSEAEFSISVAPIIDDKDKIMVLLPGTKVDAIDKETEANLQFNTTAKTTKLEDDEIAQGDGIIQ